MRRLAGAGARARSWLPAAITLVVVLAASTTPARGDPGASDPAGDAEAAAAWVGLASATTVAYDLPVAGAVLRPFEPPTTAYGAGHRGVDLDAAAGVLVRAAAPGRVRHAGPVAGITWVSIEHADGIVTSYGPLTAVPVSRGSLVASGATVGHLAAGGHGHEHADRGLHWGARVGAHYIDPMSLLGGQPLRPSLVGPGHWAATEAGPVRDDDSPSRATRGHGRAVDAPVMGRLS